MLSKFCGSLDYRWSEWSRSRIKIPPNTPPPLLSYHHTQNKPLPMQTTRSLSFHASYPPPPPSALSAPLDLDSIVTSPRPLSLLHSPVLLCSSPILLKTNSLPSPTHMATPHSLLYSVLTTPFIFFSVPRGGYRGGAAGPSHPPEISRQQMFPIS